MKGILFMLCQWTWCLPQNLLGLIFYIVQRIRRRGIAAKHRGAVATLWNIRGGLSLGMFIFLDGQDKDIERTILHEYGHTIQSMILGWFYLPVVALQSLIWAGLPVFSKMRLEKRISYYSFWTEAWANQLGGLNKYDKGETK